MTQIFFVVLLMNLGFIAHASAPPKNPSSHHTHSTSGFRLVYLEKGSIFEMAGLQVKDLIKSFNGKPVRDSKDLEALKNTLKQKEPVKIQVERNGRIETLHWNFES